MKEAIMATLCATCIAGCGGSTGDISAVKNGLLDFNKTLTIGQALDNWKNCQKSEWSEFTSDNGVKVVQFTCSEKMETYMKTLRSYFEKNDPLISYIPDYDIKTFQFTINKDGTFQLDNVSDLTKWPDGTENAKNQNPMEQIKIAYRNKMNYDMSVFDSFPHSNSASSEDVSWVLLYDYIQAKMNSRKSADAAQEAPQEPTAGTTQPSDATTRTLVDSDGVQYTVKDDPAGKLLESAKGSIILGPSCSASSPQYGEGKWGWANGGVRVEFGQTVIGFPREETPYSDDRCAMYTP